MRKENTDHYYYYYYYLLLYYYEAPLPFTTTKPYIENNLSRPWARTIYRSNYRTHSRISSSFFFFFFNFLFYFPGELYEGQTKWSIEMKTVWISGIFLHLETPTRQNKSGHLSLGWVLWWPINQMCNWPHYIACQCTLLLLHAFIHCA